MGCLNSYTKAWKCHLILAILCYTSTNSQLTSVESVHECTFRGCSRVHFWPLSPHIAGRVRRRPTRGHFNSGQAQHSLIHHYRPDGGVPPTGDSLAVCMSAWLVTMHISNTPNSSGRRHKGGRQYSLPIYLWTFTSPKRGVWRNVCTYSRWLVIHALNL